MLETASWLQYLGLAVFLTLWVWIPIAVWRTRGIWNPPWKGWTWFALHLFIGTNILLFLVYLLRIVWKRTAACHSRALKWIWRSLACVPGINPAVRNGKRIVEEVTAHDVQSIGRDGRGFLDDVRLVKEHA